MARTVNLLGVPYGLPENSETGWGTAVTNYLLALASAFPQLSGGLAALTAELDLGAAFGLKAAYLKSRTANPAASGLVRLAKSDIIGFRNNANNSDLALGISAGDALTFAGLNLTANPLLSANTSAGQAIPTGATETIVVYGNPEIDTDGAFNLSTGRYTVPVGKAGHYAIAASIAYNTAPGGTCTCSIFKNGVLFKQNQFVAPGATQGIAVAALANLAAGDVIDIRSKHGNVGSQSLTVTNAINFLTLKRIPT